VKAFNLGPVGEPNAEPLVIVEGERARDPGGTVLLV
jgi:hypothetical protein